MKTLKPRLSWIVPVLATVVVCNATAGEHRFTDGNIRFVTGTASPRLEITLTTNPALLEPLPEELDLEAVIAHSQRMMAYADWPDKPIKISIPLIGYGSSQGFSDAIIRQEAGVSVDPGSLVGSAEVRHTGSVSIKEFTEIMIEGDFSADLYSAQHPRPPKFEGMVSGWFRISHPGLSDPRIDHEPTESEQLRTIASGMWDLMRRTGMSMEDADRLDLGAGTGGGAGSGGGSSQPRDNICTCECEYLQREQSRPECVEQCTPVWEINQCDNPVMPVVGPDDAEVDRFVAALVELDLSEATINAYRISFEMSPEAVRQQLWDAVLGQQAQQNEPVSEHSTTSIGAIDAESLRYKEGIEQLGLPPELVAEMVENFQESNAAARAFLSEQLERTIQQNN